MKIQENGSIALPTTITATTEQTQMQTQMQELVHTALERFRRIVTSYAIFSGIFLCLMAFEFFYILFHLAFLAQSFALAMSIALCVATGFFYLTLRVYFQSKKEEKCIRLKEEYILACRHLSKDSTNGVRNYELTATSCCELATALHGKEYSFYSVPVWLDFLSTTVEKVSCWTHWDDVQMMKEILLQGTVNAHIEIIKIQPTDLASHAGLANAYVMLAGLYVDPRSIEGYDDDRWIPQKFGDAYTLKFRQMSERAIEEFKILNDYAPNDPWVHAQLAYSYRDLQMPQEEIREYETLFQLCPDDKEILFKLGQLYFQQGSNAKGLQVYELLKRGNYKKADQLIQHYGSGAKSYTYFSKSLL